MEKLTLSEVKKQIEQIKKGTDPEQTHLQADCLMEDFIRCIAEKRYNTTQIYKIAEEIFQLNQVELEKWYA